MHRAIAFGFLEAPLKGKLLLPTADLGDSVPLLQDVKANKPENTAGNYKCRPRKFQMRLPWGYAEGSLRGNDGCANVSLLRNDVGAGPVSLSNVGGMCYLRCAPFLTDD